MATVNDIIKRSMRMLGVYSSGEALSADEAQDGLAALNSMLAAWSLEKLTLFKHETVSYVPTTQSFTVGATGNLVTPRPVAILGAYRRQGNLDTPVDVIDRAHYEALSQKAQTGPVQAVYYKPTSTNGTVFCWPVPTGDTLFLTLQQPLTAFASITTVLELPPGYEEALTFNLAVRIAPEYEREAPPTVVRTAMNSKRLLKSVNVEIPQLETGLSSSQWWTPPV